MDIEQGSEWFHRETLAVVSIMALERVGGVPHKVWLVAQGERRLSGGAERGHAYWRDPEDFLRDYARNEPVTAELLERMGGPEWQVSIVDTLVWVPVTTDSDVPWSSGGMELRTSHPDDTGCHSIPITHPATLRDLLNVLRVFGVESPIPTAPKENQTA